MSITIEFVYLLAILHHYNDLVIKPHEDLIKIHTKDIYHIIRTNKAIQTHELELHNTQSQEWMPKEQNDMYNNQIEEKIINDVAQQRILWKQSRDKRNEQSRDLK